MLLTTGWARYSKTDPLLEKSTALLLASSGTRPFWAFVPSSDVDESRGAVHRSAVPLTKLAATLRESKRHRK
jgi:hypothetical protein